MRTLTLKQLIEANACEDQVDTFRNHFKKSIVVTEELATTLSDTFDFNWAGEHLLSHAAQDEFDKVCGPARAEYDKVCKPAWAEYQKACIPAQAEYQKACAAADAKTEYMKVCKTAWDEYGKVCSPPRAEYLKVCAVTFARLYNTDQT